MTEQKNEYDGLDLRDVLCICAVLVAAGAEDDEWIKRVCSAHAHEVLGHPDLLVLTAKVADDPPLYDPECICGSWDDTHPGDCPAVRVLPPVQRCQTCIHPEGYDRLSGPCPTCNGDGVIPPEKS